MELASISLREANQHFSALVRQVETTGHGYLVLRHGRPVARLLPAEEESARLSPEQGAALRRLLATTWSPGSSWSDGDGTFGEHRERIRRGG